MKGAFILLSVKNDAQGVDSEFNGSEKCNAEHL
ncbi:hypothetical protein SAMN05444414_103145 [Roseovarius marisflavi]|uniref:Uncharacterized protein n=1 Tax=Roseovarius marisflavi TaxID=1054996 RepID=A0A1M6WW40_9RHOB|nr:hypothetical protein SAMN05444414_103145 [Roseovarius marisflavi]